MDSYRANILGSIIGIFILVICSLVFVSRLAGNSKLEYWLGIVFILTALPISYLLLTAGKFNRPTLYYVQLGLMLAFIIAELLLDYIFKIDFRNIGWMTVSYVILFFAATGGMIGIASLSGKVYLILAVIFFFIMTFLALYQRCKTGM